MISYIKKLFYYFPFLLIVISFCEIGRTQLNVVDLELDISLINRYEARGEEHVVIEIAIRNCCNRLREIHPCLNAIEPKLKFTIPSGLEIATDGSAFNLATGVWLDRFDYDTGIFTVPGISSCDLTFGLVKFNLNAILIDKENAQLLVEVYEYSDPTLGIVVFDSDSHPNNGVDTDGDGNISDDPDDEDDGDGIDFARSIDIESDLSCECEHTATPVTPAPVVATDDGCLGPIDQRSSIAPNPEDDVNGVFNFDYRINATIEVNADYDGVLRNKRYKTDFYVNSADGSAYFPKGFFISNFGSDTWMGRKMHGSIWMSNGQLVSYVEDTRAGMAKKMAVTVDIDQTSSDVAGGQFAFINQFMNGIGTATSTPAPMPADLPWGDTEGFVSEIEQADGSTGKITIYFDREINMPPIHTNVPLVGFLVGVVKDNVNRNCNRLAVFTKMEIEGSSEYIQGELLSMEPEEISFEKPDFKPTILGAGNVSAIAAMTKEEQEDMIASQQNLNSRIQAKIAEIAACGTDDACVAAKTLEMQALVKQKQDAMYDLMTDTSGAGGSGSDLLIQQRAFRDQLFTLNQTLLGKEQACEERLQEAYEACDSTRDDTRACNEAERLVAQCRTEIEAIKIEMKRLECEMAKLHGFEDSMEDCE